MTEQSELVARGLEAFQEASTRASNAEARADLYERSNALLTHENEALRAMLVKANAERDYYMRHTTELVTHLTNGVELIEAALTAARQGAYRPNGAVATDPVSSDAEPIPQFLQTPLESLQ